MTAPYDVIVVGAGPIGAACAREIALLGSRVAIFDPGGSMGQAWQAAAGMLAPQIESQGEDALLDLGVAAREIYAPLSEALRDTTGLDIGLWQEGIAWVASEEEEAGELRSRVASQRQQGHVSDWLDEEEVRARWPWLGRTHGALWAPHEGAVEPERLVQALLADAARLRAVLIQEGVEALEHSGDRVLGVRTARGRYSAPNVVIAAGAWSGLIDGLPRPLSVEPVRGQMAAFPWPPGARPAIVYGSGCYILARGKEAIVGSTMEYAGFRPEVTSAGLGRLFTSVTQLCPTLTRAEVRRTWAGLRPVTPDGLPIVGAEPRLQGLWYATGHGRNGILLAGITGRLIGQLLNGEPGADELAAVSPARFWKW